MMYIDDTPVAERYEEFGVRLPDGTEHPFRDEMTARVQTQFTEGAQLIRRDVYVTSWGEVDDAV